MKKIISLSLWCSENPLCKNKINENKNMYCKGAIRNLEIQRDLGIYKDWTFRFYVNNTVPKNVIQILKYFKAEIIDMTGSKIPGMFWRFLPFDDSSVDIFIVRDVDSRINKREELAVKEWLESDKLLHIMRDHPHHYYKILGGMWGYKNNVNRIFINQLMSIFLRKNNWKFKRMDDMKFLDLVYDSLKGKSMEHDQYFKFEFSQPFPEMDIDTSKYYHFVGEIFDEHDNNPNKNRNAKLIENQFYKIKMKNHHFAKFFK